LFCLKKNGRETKVVAVAHSMEPVKASKLSSLLLNMFKRTEQRFTLKMKVRVKVTMNNQRVNEILFNKIVEYEVELE
jgi:hypothetical protein